MTSTELAALDATAQAELVAGGEISALEMVDAAIERIESVNSQLNAVITPLFEKARALAASGRLPDGPFKGVPFLFKDLDCTTEGDPFHGGMRYLRDMNWVEDHDSYLSAKFRDAGFIPMGKTNTPELGLTVTTEPEAYGPSRNPWNPEHSTGGSSGGSAAAVASGMVAAAHASDGGGSIRIPASECGLVGLKPSRGRISLGPDRGDYWNGCVTSLVVTRSVRDTATVLDAVAGAMPGDPYTAPRPLRPYSSELASGPGRLRIGVFDSLPGGFSQLHGDCVRALEATAAVLEEMGHRVEVSHPEAMDGIDEFRRHFMTLISCWVAASLNEWGERTGRPVVEDSVEAPTWAMAEMGRATGAADYIATTKWCGTFTREMASWWSGGFDILVTPTIAQPPPEIGYLSPPPGDPMGNADRLLGLIPYTPEFNVTGQPALSLPLHWNDAGLPIGVQFIAEYGREDLLLGLAARLEEAMPWTQRRPAVWAGS